MNNFFKKLMALKRPVFIWRICDAYSIIIVSCISFRYCKLFRSVCFMMQNSRFLPECSFRKNGSHFYKITIKEHRIYFLYIRHNLNSFRWRPCSKRSNLKSYRLCYIRRLKCFRIFKQHCLRITFVYSYMKFLTKHISKITF